MRNTQQILNKVIKAGIYSDTCYQDKRNAYMCLSLEIAREKGLITAAEKNKATKEILKDISYLARYIGQTGVSLSYSLHAHNLPSRFSDRLKIYQNWKKRPYPVGKRNAHTNP